MKTRTGTLLVTALALVLAGGAGSRAQNSTTAWRPPVELLPVLTVRVSTTGEHTYDIPGSTVVARGDFEGVVLTPGFADASSLCPNSVQMAVGKANIDNGRVSWLVETRLVDVHRDEATIDLRWSRHVNEGGLAPAATFAEERRLVLREGDRGVLDLLRAEPARGGGCSSLALEYEFHLEGSRALTNAAIEYDVWLVQQDASGSPITARVDVTARQDQQVEFFFPPVDYARDGSLATAGAAVRTQVRGAVRGRVRSDGDIDLSIEAVRQFQALDLDGSGVASASNSGRSLLTVRPGETVESAIDLPTASLRGIGPLSAAFGTQRAAIRVTAKRLW